MQSEQGKDFPDLSKSGALAIRDGDFLIEDGDFALEDRVEAHLGLYHSLARQNYRRTQGYESKYSALIEALHSDAHPDLRRELAIWLEQWTIPSVVFSALCVEALLNYYGANRLGQRFTAALEKQSALRKLRTLPGIVLGAPGQHQVPEDLVLSLTRLFDIRNRLVHFKTSVFRSNVVIPEHRVTLKDSEEALDIPKRVCSYLSAIDIGFRFAFSQEEEAHAFERDFANEIRLCASFLGTTAPNLDETPPTATAASTPFDI